MKSNQFEIHDVFLVRSVVQGDFPIIGTAEIKNDDLAGIIASCGIYLSGDGYYITREDTNKGISVLAHTGQRSDAQKIFDRFVRQCAEDEDIFEEDVNVNVMGSDVHYPTGLPFTEEEKSEAHRHLMLSTAAPGPAMMHMTMSEMQRSPTPKPRRYWCPRCMAEHGDLLPAVHCCSKEKGNEN